MQKVNGSIKVLLKVKSLNGGIQKVGAKTKCTRIPMKSQFLIPDSSKVVQKIFSFGPAHAEQARKLFGHRNTAHVEQARKLFGHTATRNAGKAHVPFHPMLGANPPTLKIASISPRPSSKHAMKSNKDSVFDFSSKSIEGFVRDGPLKFEDTMRQKGSSSTTILELLEELSL